MPFGWGGCHGQYLTSGIQATPRLRGTNYLRRISEYVRRTVRKLTPDELARVAEIMATRWPRASSNLYS